MSSLDDPAVSRASDDRRSNDLPEPTIVGYSAMSGSYRVSRPRGSSTWLLMATVGGAGEVHQGGGACRVGVGDVVLLEPGVEQRYGTVGSGWTLWWCHFPWRPRWTDSMRAVTPGSGLYLGSACGAHDRVVATFERAYGDAGGDHRALRSIGDRDDVEVFAVCPDLLADLVATALDETLLLTLTTSSTADPIETARRAIWSNPAAPHSVSSLAATAGMSRSHFAHEFRRRAGISPMRLVSEERLSLARRLMVSTDLPVSRVAAACGLADPAYFSRAYARRFGRAPSADRRAVVLDAAGDSADRATHRDWCD